MGDGFRDIIISVYNYYFYLYFPLLVSPGHSIIAVICEELFGWFFFLKKKYLYSRDEYFLIFYLVFLINHWLPLVNGMMSVTEEFYIDDQQHYARGISTWLNRCRSTPYHGTGDIDLCQGRLEWRRVEADGATVHLCGGPL